MVHSPPHGGNVYEIAARLGCAPEDLLDFSASINPLGPPPGLFEEFARLFHRLQHYPDIANRGLIEVFAAHHRVPQDWIVVGNGSTELIYWLPQALGVRRALIVVPTFSEYQRAFVVHGVELAKLATSPGHGFQPSIAELERACTEVRPEAVLVTHPGSPSGSLIPPAVCAWLVARSREGLFCLVDEAFVDFCEERSWKEHLSTSEGLVLIRSMTKFYAIPGLRLGYLLTSPTITRRLRGLMPPWSVNTCAQIAGGYCLAQDAYRQETLTTVAHARQALVAGLQSIPGLQPFPGEANYLLVKLAAGLPPAHALQERLLTEERILVRDCGNFAGLGERYVRLAVRLPAENERLLNALRKWRRALGGTG